jgi:methionine-rich copper-binding protein CopC
MEKKENEFENATVKDEKNEEVSVDSTSIKDGKPQQLETKEKNQYREEHGDLTNDQT